MVKLKVLSGVLSLAVMCSASMVNAESAVVGQQRVGSQVSAYIEGDKITTGSDVSASVALTSGSAKVVAAPNTIMAVTNASLGHFSLDQGAFKIQAVEGQQITISTAAGTFELNSSTSIDAITSFVNGEFTAFSKSGLLTVSSQDGTATSIDAGNAFVYSNQGASSLDVQAAGSNHSSALNQWLIAGGVAIATIVAFDSSDADDAELDEASPAE